MAEIWFANVLLSMKFVIFKYIFPCIISELLSCYLITKTNTCWCKAGAHSRGFSHLRVTLRSTRKQKKRYSLQHVVKMSQRFQFYWGRVRDDDADIIPSDDERFWLEHDYGDYLVFISYPLF